jgi:hypothetical protein
MARVLIWTWDVAVWAGRLYGTAARGLKNYLASVGSITDLVDHSLKVFRKKNLLHRLTGGSRFDTKIIAHACVYFPVVRSP